MLLHIIHAFMEQPEVESNEIHLLKLLYWVVFFFVYFVEVVFKIGSLILFLLDYVLSEVLQFATLKIPSATR